MSIGRQRFSIIPAPAVTDARLEPRDLQVLCLLGRHTDDMGWCCRSQVKMAKEIGCGRATIYRAINRLVDCGYLERRTKQRESGADAAHDYRVVIDRPDHETTTKQRKGMVPTHGQGVPIDGQGCPPMDGQGVPTHERAPRLTNPFKRIEKERARETVSDGNGISSDDRFEDFFATWPTAIADDRNAAIEAWQALSADDQAEALAEVPRYVTALQALKRNHVCAAGRYLSEKRWKLLPPRPKLVEGQTLGASANLQTLERVEIKTQPTRFQLANPHLYPELFDELPIPKLEDAT